jgi:hypothetical protein
MSALLERGSDVPGRLDHHVDLDQRGALRREPSADRVGEIVEALHLHSARTERVRQRDEVRVREIGLAPAPLERSRSAAAATRCEPVVRSSGMFDGPTKRGAAAL